MHSVNELRKGIPQLLACTNLFLISKSVTSEAAVYVLVGYLLTDKLAYSQ
jgi:hypothetical protein